MATDDDDTLELVALHGEDAPETTIVPASRWRDWMNDAPERWPNRCLPLLVANESGWALLNPVAFTATWNGDQGAAGIDITFDEPTPRPPVSSHFGYGILTWAPAALFRTPPGYNLLARGPANMPKDGIGPLEGVIETDWSVATFTMNWKITRPGHPVRFERDEPYCVLVPQRRGELETFRPVHRRLSSEPEAESGKRAYDESREDLKKRKFLASFVGEVADATFEWEATYFRGRTPDGREFPGHQTKLRLRAFTDERADASARSPRD